MAASANTKTTMKAGAAKNGETGNGVRARMKNLRHGPLLCREVANTAQTWCWINAG